MKVCHAALRMCIRMLSAQIKERMFELAAYLNLDCPYTVLNFGSA